MKTNKGSNGVTRGHSFRHFWRSTIACCAIATAGTASAITVEPPPVVPAKPSSDADDARKALIEVLNGVTDASIDIRQRLVPPSAELQKEFEAIAVMFESLRRLRNVADAASPTKDVEIRHRAIEVLQNSDRTTLENVPVVVQGDTATLTFAGNDAPTYKLKRVNGTWLVEARQIIDIGSSSETLAVAGWKTQAMDAVAEDIQAGKEKPPFQISSLVDKKMAEQARNRGSTDPVPPPERQRTQSSPAPASPQTPTPKAETPSPTTTTDSDRCREAFLKNSEGMFTGSASPREAYAPPPAESKAGFDAFVAMLEATQRLQKAVDAASPAEQVQKMRDAIEKEIAKLRAAVEAGTVAIEGDKATLTYTIENPMSAQGSSVATQTLKRIDGKWRMDPARMLGGSAETIEMLREQTQAMDEVTGDIKAGKEKPPFLTDMLVSRKIMERAFKKELEKKPAEPAKAPVVPKGLKTPEPSTKVEPTPPPVDPKPAPGEKFRLTASGRIRCLAFPARFTMISGATHTDDSLILWDVKGKKKLRTFTEPGKEFHVLGLDVSRDGKRIVSGGQSFDAQAVKTARSEKPAKNPYDEAGPEDCDLRVWNTTTGKLERRISRPGNTVVSLGISPNDRFIASGDDMGEVHIHNLAMGEQVRVLKASKFMGTVATVQFSHDGKTLAAGPLSHDKESIIVYDVETWTVKRTIDLDRSMGIFDLSPGGQSIAASRPGLIAIFGAEAKPTAGLMCVGHGQASRVNSIAYSKDGKWLLSAEGVDYDLRSLAGLMFDDTPQVRIFDMVGGVGGPKQVALLSGHADSVRAAAFAPDGESIVTGSSDGTIRVWELPAVMKAKGSEKP